MSKPLTYNFHYNAPIGTVDIFSEEVEHLFKSGYAFFLTALIDLPTGEIVGYNLSPEEAKRINNGTITASEGSSGPTE